MMIITQTILFLLNFTLKKDVIHDRWFIKYISYRHSKSQNKHANSHIRLYACREERNKFIIKSSERHKFRFCIIYHVVRTLRYLYPIRHNDVINYLDNLRKPEYIDPQHKWIATHNVRLVHIVRIL
jgi:hypothetical protein